METTSEKSVLFPIIYDFLGSQGFKSTQDSFQKDAKLNKQGRLGDVTTHTQENLLDIYRAYLKSKEPSPLKGAAGKGDGEKKDESTSSSPSSSSDDEMVTEPTKDIRVSESNTLSKNKAGTVEPTKSKTVPDNKKSDKSSSSSSSSSTSSSPTLDIKKSDEKKTEIKITEEKNHLKNN